jgi:hypothetical protein
MISKLLLWFGFLMSLFVLPFGLFKAEKANPLALLFWTVILVGSAYKLFFKESQK